MFTKDSIDQRAENLVMPRELRRRLRREVPKSARRLYVVGLLVASDNGFVSDADLDAAWHDLHVRETVDRLMADWGL